MPELSEGHTESEKFNVINIPMLVSVLEKKLSKIYDMHAKLTDSIKKFNLLDDGKKRFKKLRTLNALICEKKL